MISVIIPVYNGEKYLFRCLSSVVGQSYPLFEVICVDDGSEDFSAEIISYYSFRYPCVRMICVGENRGVSHARNVGMDAAVGRFIVFLDADDELVPGALAKMRGAFDENPVDILIADGLRDYGDKRIALPVGKQNKEFLLKDKAAILSLSADFVARPNDYTPLTVVWGKMFLADFLLENKIRFNDWLCSYEDLGFMFDSLFSAGRVAYRKIPVCVSYRSLENSASRRGVMYYFSNVKKGIIEVRKRMFLSGFFPEDIEEISWKGFTTHMVTALYKMAQYLNRDNFWEVISCAGNLLNDSEFQKRMNYYSAKENRNFPIITYFVRKRMPIAVLLTFRAQAGIYAVSAIVRKLKLKFLEESCGKMRILAELAIQWSIRQLETLLILIRGKESKL